MNKLLKASLLAVGLLGASFMLAPKAQAAPAVNLVTSTGSTNVQVLISTPASPGNGIILHGCVFNNDVNVSSTAFGWAAAYNFALFDGATKRLTVSLPTQSQLSGNAPPLTMNFDAIFGQNQFRLRNDFEITSSTISASMTLTCSYEIPRS